MPSLDAPGSPRRWLHRLAVAVLPLLMADVLGCSALTLVTWAAASRDTGAHERSRGVNALWAAHTWVGDPHSDTEYRALAALLLRNEISDVFFHAGPLEADGSVPDTLFLHAEVLTGAMHRYAPDVRLQAYLGQIENRGGGPLDLGDATVRERIASTARQMLDAGFDGIHYDIEPIHSGDERFLDLLDRTRAVTDARGAVLSVALEEMELMADAGPLGGGNPDRAYLREVAARADQIAIMTYDSGVPTDWLFTLYVSWQTQRVWSAVGEQATIFIGVPTYGKSATGKHYAWAEHMASGIRGVRNGLAALRDGDTQRVGVAVYAEWTTSDAEWAEYYNEWIAPPP